MNKIVSSLSAIVLAATLSVGMTGHAEEQSSTAPTPPAISEEQKAEMAKQFEAEYKEMQDKFSALSDKEKKEIYDLYDKVNVAKVKLLDKYVELGLMSKDEAKEIQQHMADVAEKVREENQFIGFKAPHLPKEVGKNPASNQKSE